MKLTGSARVSRAVLVFLFLFVLVLAAIGVCAAASEAEAETKIEEVEGALTSAFVAVLSAERSGADVSDLLIKLDSAGEFLAEARMCYRNGDFEGAVYYANVSVQMVLGLVEEAERSEASALDEFNERLFETAAVSSVAVSVIISGCFVGWGLFKRRYFRRVLEMKPEVLESES